MDLDYIYTYINELNKCIWQSNAFENGIKYNDIDIAKGTEYYWDMLFEMHEKVEKMLIELSVNGQLQILKALYSKLTQISEQTYDVLTTDDVECLKRDTTNYFTTAIKMEIALGNFIIQMHGIQRYFQLKLLKFLGDLLGIQTQPVTDETDIEVEDVEPTQTPQSEDKRIIKGVKGLGTHLGCGVTKAQEILNSGILQKNGIAYPAGKGWRINREKLDKFLAENPYTFKGKLKKDFDL